MLARNYYPHKQLNGKKKQELHDLIHDAGDNWAELPTSLKRGRCIIKKEVQKYIDNEYFAGEVVRLKWTLDQEIPIFTEDRNYILNEIPPISVKTKNDKSSK
jgi:tRNA(His) 5'-end guanylyltransferase